MSIEHKNIPDAQLHEPKGAASATNGEVYVADGAGSGVWKKLSEDSLERTDSAHNMFGWIDVSDSLYTSASPRSITSGTRTQLTNNGLATQSNTERLGTLWDTTANTFTIDDLNAVYVIRTTFKLKAAAASGTPYTIKLEFETDNGPLVFLQHSHYVKGGDYENAVAFTDMFYVGPVINGTTITAYVTPDTAITLYDVGFLVQRLYTEKNS